MISIKHINAENLSDALSLRLLPGQEKYVALPAESLAMAYVYYNSSIPLGVYCGDKMVGYAMVVYDRDAAAYSVCHFCIDAAMQRKGYGRDALGILLQYAAAQPLGDADRITVSCAEDNEVILKLNREYGFEQTGKHDEVYIDMTLPIAAVTAPLSDEDLKNVTGGFLDTDRVGTSCPMNNGVIMVTSSSSGSARINTGDARGQLTEEQLTPAYIRRQIFGAKFDELYGN